MSFNPRTPCGVRPASSLLASSFVTRFNPRTPCGVRPRLRGIFTSGTSFNPRTPCGVRRGLRRPFPVPEWFQSTHSLRSATIDNVRKLHCICVSIHALLAECDPGVRPAKTRICSFNPRTPCGVRRGENPDNGRTLPFQSTHSLRSATSSVQVIAVIDDVSIHALLAECD